MTKGQKYAISFQRKIISGGNYDFATTTDVNNEAIANHISDSDK